MRGWLVVYAKGFCMGAADMVPGVSGGTIALIVGIYERLVRAIAALDPRVLHHAVSVHRQDSRMRLIDDLRAMDLPFLLVLGLGIGTAVLIVARIMITLFEAYPAQLNAFFFGLIGASAIVIGKDLSLTPKRLGVALVGFILAVLLTGTEQLLGGHSLVMIFVAGAIAISAMILPGISGAAFLYILGQYEPLLGELRDLMDAVGGLAFGGSTNAIVDPGIVVITFMVGAVIGLLTMARIVSWSLARYRMATLAFLVALMLGSLRLPITEVHREWGMPGLGEWGWLVLAAGIGIGAVLALDHYSASLDYANPE